MQKIKITDEIQKKGMSGLQRVTELCTSLNNDVAGMQFFLHGWPPMVLSGSTRFFCMSHALPLLDRKFSKSGVL
jgi:hypothetical protein